MLALSLWLSLTDAVSTCLWYLCRPAQGEPGTANIESLRQRLLGGEIAEVAQHQIVHEGATESRAELFGDGGPKLAETHPLSVSGSR